MKENKRKCVKCGASPMDNPEIKLYRFPKPGSTNAMRCEIWAKYCFPDKSWASGDFQNKLYSEHRMLCHQHFKETSFVDYPSKKLRRFASPDIEEVTLSHPLVHNMEAVAETSQQPLLDVTNRPPPTTLPHQVPNMEAVAGTSQQPLMDILNKPPPTTLPSLPLHNEEAVAGKSQQPYYEKLPPAIPGPSKIGSESSGDKCNDLIQPAFEKCKRYLQKVSRLQRSVRYLKNKDFLNKLCRNSALTLLSKKISPTFALLLQGQIQNYKKKPKGRRWTTEDKVTALRLYKRSPTCYRLLRRMFLLPSQTSLKVLLKKCSLKVGINEHIFKIIAKFASDQKPQNNQFVLMFDEMAIRKNIQYNASDDIIEGFQDHGKQGRTAQPASYALVFMVACIRKKIKQPVAYYLSGTSVTADRLAVLIKEVLGECFKHGINIAATVCDMDGVNRRALTILGATVSTPYFESNTHEVVALFDAPHLIKCFRNLFMKYDIEWLTDISSNEKSGKGIAKWSHIVQFHELDNANPNYAFAPLLKQDHLNPNTKQKMKVKLAVQVLSHTVSAGMYARIGKGLPTEAIATADMISQIDKIFDTLNSDTPDLRRGKPFSTNLKEKSPHLPFIKEMKIKFQAMKYIGATRAPPSQEGWLWTLTGVERLWWSLRQKYPAIKSLSTRRLQQDPLENLFGCIRANCGANCNPTTGQFIGALKTALLTNLAHTGSGNCQKDENEVMINNFKLIINEPKSDQLAKNTSPTSSGCSFKEINDNLEEDSSEVQACAYVCGFIIKRIKSNCQLCMDALITKDHMSIHTFVEFKEYTDKESLHYPHKSFVLCAEECATLINSYLKKNSHLDIKIKKYTIEIVKKTVNFDFLNDCTEHKESNINLIVASIFYINVKRYCVKTNRCFAEEAAKSSLKKKLNILTHK